MILATVLNKCFKSRLSLCEADRRKCCVRSDREAYFLKKIVLKLLTPAYLVTGNTLKRKQSLMGVHVTQPTVPKSKLFWAELTLPAFSLLMSFFVTFYTRPEAKLIRSRDNKITIGTFPFLCTTTIMRHSFMCLIKGVIRYLYGFSTYKRKTKGTIHKV